MKWTNEILHSSSSWYKLGPVEFAVKTTIDRWGADTKGLDGLISLRSMDSQEDAINILFAAETHKEAVKQAADLRDFAHMLLLFADSWDEAANTIVEEPDREMN